MEPAGVVLPDGADAPGDLAVALPDIQLGWKLDLAHQRPDVAAFVHSAHGLVVHVLHGAAQAQEFAADELPTRHRIVMSNQEELGLEGQHAVEGIDEAERIPVAVAPDGDEVREVSEESAEQVPGEADAVLREPDHHGVRRLAAGRRDQLEAKVAELEGIAVLEGDVGLGPGLRWNGAAEIVADVAEGLRDRRREGKGASRRPESLDAGVVRLLGGVVRVGDDPGLRLAKAIDAAQVIDVPLGQQDVADGPPVHGVEVALVHRRLEAHARVDHDPAGGGHHQEGVR
jgi:hypothetical protein